MTLHVHQVDWTGWISHVHLVDWTGKNEYLLIKDHLAKDQGGLFCTPRNFLACFIWEDYLDFACSPGGLDRMDFTCSPGGLDWKKWISPYKGPYGQGPRGVVFYPAKLLGIYGLKIFERTIWTLHVQRNNRNHSGYFDSSLLNIGLSTYKFPMHFSQCIGILLGYCNASPFAWTKWPK